MRMLSKIISGGQTGADRAALDCAIAHGMAHGGAIPAGRKAEDGPLPARYEMRELSSPHYQERTAQNVNDGDGTLIVSHGALSGGSAFTRTVAQRLGKPMLHLDLAKYRYRDGTLSIDRLALGQQDYNPQCGRPAGQFRSEHLPPDLLSADGGTEHAHRRYRCRGQPGQGGVFAVVSQR